MKKIMSIALIALFVGAPLVAAEKNDAEVKKAALLKKEIVALKSLKNEKLNVLEKKEADRWNARYKQNIQAKEFEDKTRMLESRYTKLASTAAIKKDELQRYKRFTEEEGERLEVLNDRIEGFKTEVKQNIDKQAQELSRDMPLRITERTAQLSKASSLAESKNSIHEAIELYVAERANRLELTITQELRQKNSIVAGIADVPVKQLRLGTVFIGELERGGQNRVQTLLRTGQLQGKIFTWRSNLKESYEQNVATAISAAVGAKVAVVIPMDVLQTKSLGRGYTKDAKSGFWVEVQVWFGKGGVVMYPLIGCAFLAFILALERLLLYRKRGRSEERFMRTIRPMVRKKNWEGVKKVCNASKSSLSCVIYAIMNSVEGSRDGAEKAVKENLLKELPELEKRLGIVAALGASAPLLGLLGTVSGMITLFMVITDVGTNDPKILAGGISEALVTTQTGLVIAIPILLIHGYLSEKLESITANLQGYSMEVLNKIWPDSGSEL
ncbi:MAG: MotA/TolQ/ExbB proton channel family protein [Fibrobacterales bacterium]